MGEKIVRAEPVEEEFRLEKCLRKLKDDENHIHVQDGGAFTFDKRHFLKYFKDPVIIDVSPMPQLVTGYIIAERNPAI